MIDWIFLWSTKRPALWESVTENMNSVFWESNFDYENYVIPVNKINIDSQYNNLDFLNDLNGPVLDQFENESFKFVIQPNSGLSSYNRQDQMVLKQHMFPDFSLSGDNCKSINLDLIYELVNKYKWVSIGTIFSGPDDDVRLNKLNSIAASSIFIRDIDTLKISVLDKNNQPDNDITYMSCVTYMTFQKLKDDSVVLCILNPHLVSLTHSENLTLDKIHRISALNSHDTSIENFLLKPNINVGKLNSSNLIFSDNRIVEIAPFKNSTYWHKYGSIPSIPYSIESNLPYVIDCDIIKILTDKSIGYFSIIFDVGSMTNLHMKKNTFGKINFDFTIIGDV